MRIQNSSVAMAGESRRIEVYSKEESLRAWVDKDGRLPGNAMDQKSIILEISEEAKAMEAKASKIGEAEEIELEISDGDKQKLLLIQRMIEYLTGKKIKFYLPKKLKLDNPNNAVNGSGQNSVQAKQGWGIVYESRESHIEQESMSFAAKGTIHTSDGRTISLELSLNVSRSFAYSSNISFRAGDAVMVDPLVINFGTSSAGLTEGKFQFDLDADGKTEPISFLSQGSGFIALDINNDGIINDGSELFGTRTGDGFKELSVFDEDNNGWIDENDPIYEKLRIWIKDDKGNDQLLALGQKGVGAIYLGNAAADFSLKNSDNSTNGQIKRTGIYLKENGSAGTVQHVDIAI